jgi:hypothetical protein
MRYSFCLEEPVRQYNFCSHNPEQRSSEFKQINEAYIVGHVRTIRYKSFIFGGLSIRNPLGWPKETGQLLSEFVNDMGDYEPSPTRLVRCTRSGVLNPSS